MSHSLPATASALKYVVQCTSAFAELCRYGTAELDADNDDIAYYFHSHREPNVALTDYMRRVEAETRCGEDAFYITLILIGRACNDRRSSKVLLPSVLTAHRLFLTGLRVATKMHHDLHRSNRTFAKLGGITNLEMNQLEFLFLDKIGFNASVLPEELERVKSAVHLASGLGTSQTIARLLANAMGLEVSTRLRRPKSEFAFKEATLPPVTDTVSGGGRAAVRTLRAGRMSASGSMNSSSGAFTSATPLRFPPTGDLQLSTSSLLLASQSLVSPDASP